MTRTELDQKVHFAKDQMLLLASMVEDAMYRSVRRSKTMTWMPPRRFSTMTRPSTGNGSNSRAL